eukprot:TRINITY_DN7128_c0_g4_i2.p1 TRINITY_DN7128_c0_g4~~TRINITY_DN7128_c0_g4_i2.p1  ORF type:complete len:180 (+),score=13.09 TRINITY_DN7128_c0_g4_i2:69-608(+)
MCIRDSINTFLKNISRVDKSADNFTSLPIIDWIPTVIGKVIKEKPESHLSSKDSLFSIQDYEDLLHVCEKYTQMIDKISPKLVNFLEINCCPIKPLLFGFFYSNGLALLPINHAILFVLATMTQEEKDTAEMIVQFMEEKLKPFELLGASKTYKRLYSSKTLTKFPEKCIQIIQSNTTT